ncbi:MAG: ankyrin repeat domain-containing protein [Methylococcales bacterium]
MKTTSYTSLCLLVLVVIGTTLEAQPVFAKAPRSSAKPSSKKASTASAQQVIDAAEAGDLLKVQALLTAGADVNAKNEVGGTALMDASRNGHKEIVKALIAKGADVNAKDNEGRNTALFYAASHGHQDVVKALKQAGAR